MPAYPWLFEQDVDLTTTEAKLKVLKQLGVPYEDEYIANANQELMNQAREITADLAKEGLEVRPESEIVAMIAYLQRLGTDIKVKAEEVEE
jgi:cytochrome c oxidase cbb3-type subunit I/II